jgi:UDP:flavonoid glycosyltransferase YjiC (YdhE family)
MLRQPDLPRPGQKTRPHRVCPGLPRWVRVYPLRCGLTVSAPARPRNGTDELESLGHMRVTMLAVGSRGDVEPAAAVGTGLRARGYDVRLGAPPEFSSMAEAAGLEFAPVGPTAAEVLDEPDGRRVIRGDGGILGQALALRRALAPLAERFATDGVAAVDGSDAVVHNPMAHLGRFAEELGVPSMLMSLWPKSRTEEFPAVGFPHAPLLGAAYNRLTHALYEQLAWRPFQGLGNEIRAGMGLPPLRGETPLGRDHRDGRPVLYGFSRHVVPPPADWRSALNVCGYWFLDPPASRRQPAGLEDFLADGEPPVVVTFGSMALLDPEGLTRTAVEALRLVGRRGVLLGPLAAGPTAGDMFDVADVPSSWLFHRAAAVVHHGGAGTTAACLRAGVPSVAVPFFADQPFWARRLRRLGAGAGPVPHRRITAGRLAAAIRRATQDPSLRAGAVRLGRAVRAEDGLQRAVDTVEHDLLGVPVAAPVPAVSEAG